MKYRSMAESYVLHLLLICCWTTLSINVVSVMSEVYPSIQWTAQNQLFQLNSTISVRAKSKITIICPNLATVMNQIKDSPPPELLFNNLWIVNNESYWSCNASSPDSRLLLKCDSPLALKYYPIIFQQYSASSSLEFKKGKEYYFIATSDGTKGSISNRQGGHCKTHNLRIRFYICRHGTDERCDPRTTVSTTASTLRESSRSSETVTTKLFKTIKTERSSATTTRLKTTQRTTTVEDVANFMRNEEPDKPVMNYRTGDTQAITINTTIIIILVVIIVLLAASNTYLYCRLKSREENSKSLDRKPSLCVKISSFGRGKNREKPTSDIVML